MRRLSYANVMATIAVVVALGGGSFAIAQSGSGDTIRGCMNKKSGLLRVLSVPGKKCKRGERAISWNIEGPAGLPGAAGAAGSQGPTGPKGADGQSGGPGPTGPKGADGQNGSSGPTGPKGADGHDGSPGPTGPKGATGQNGSPGPTGPAGSPDTASQILAKLVTVDGANSGLDADLLDGLSSTSYARKVVSSTLFIGYSAEAYDDPGECVNQFYTNVSGLELGDQVVASVTRNGSELTPPTGLLSSAWIVERLEGDVEVPRILVRLCNVTPGVIESVGLNIRATVYR